MRVAIFKRFPLVSGFVVHSLHRAVRRSKGVDHLEHYVRSPLAARPLLNRADRFVGRALLGGPVHEYQRMNDPALIGEIRQKEFDIIIPDGQSIVSQAFIESARVGVLLFHYGSLPGMRGMNTVEWCLLLGRPPATTLYFYDSGIDTGDIVFVEPVPGPFVSIEQARRRAHRISLELMGRFFADPAASVARRRAQRPEEGVTYYVMHPSLKRLVDWRLSRRREGTAADVSGLPALLARLPAPGATAAPEGTLGDALRGLGAPPQELVAQPADQLAGVLHFLRKRKGKAAEWFAVAAASLDSLLAGGELSMEVRLRITNELLTLLDQDPAAPPLSVPSAQALLRETVAHLVT
jgi:folate-dependent phosphoribosylglycinamide formyltransferase PurN